MPDDLDEFIEAELPVQDGSDDEIPPEPPAQGTSGSSLPQPPVETGERLPPTGTFPPDIEAVWGVSPESRDVAAKCIANWGLEGFRASALHTAALKDAEREAKMTVIRKAFIDARKKAEKGAKS